MKLWRPGLSVFVLLSWGILPVWILPDLASRLHAAGPMISEIQPVNSRTLQDEDGEYSDWIEIANPGSTDVDLDGWYLTDDPTELRKWRFPAVILPARGYLVVFTSGKHRTDPSLELHTNFRLSSTGEFLALVNTAGTPVSGFAPAYPAQYQDISFGYPQSQELVKLLSAGAAARALVPSSSALGTTWRQVSFDDTAWAQGPTGVGYDTGSDYGSLIGLDVEAAMRGTNPSAYARIPFNVDDAGRFDSLTLRMKYDDGFVAYLNGQEVARRNAPATPQWNSVASREHGQPITGSMAQSFDGGGTAYELTAHNQPQAPVVKTGGPSGSYLQLTQDMTGSLANTIGFARTFGPANVIVMDFDYRMSAEAGYTGNERADGFGVALLSTIEYGDSGPGPYVDGIVWERPFFPDAFGVGFDIYDGTKTENTVSLDWYGVEVASTKVTAFDLNTGVFNRVRIEVESWGDDATVTVKITKDVFGAASPTVTVFNKTVIPGMAPFDHRIAFGGRTGGEFVGIDLDNVSVNYTYGSPEISYEDIDISDKLSALRTGTNVLAIQGLNVSAGDADLLILPELDAIDFGAFDMERWTYFPDPTPGFPNAEGYPGIAKAPLLSHSSGAYPSNFSLTMAPATPGATIRYTVDGTEPKETSPQYTSPITISQTRLVRAREFETGLFPSRIVERTYFRLGASVASFSSNLPIAIIDTFNQGIGQSIYTRVASIFIEPIDGRAAISDLPTYSGPGGIQIRGSSSSGFPKKYYKFETWDPYGEDLDVPLLGFPEDSDWVLLGPYTDKALMRDFLAYSWCNEIGTYAPRTRFFELFLMPSTGLVAYPSHYAGTYVLIEKIKRGRDRVNIKELLPSHDTEPDISGGYILKKDRLDPGDTGFTTSRGHVLGFVEPKEVEATPAQRAWIANYMNSFEAALYGANFRDPVNGYAKYIDPDSFIDHHIMVEVTKNIDGYRLSTYMFKDRGQKLNMGPIWDYNLSLGNANYLDGWKPDGWYYALVGAGDYPWYGRLFQDPDFKQRYIDRWTDLRRTYFQTSHLLAWVDDTTDLLWESQVRNFQKWPILGTYIWPNWYIANTYQEEIDWMKGWISDRVDWIDSVFPTPPVFSQNGGALPAGGINLTMTAPAGAIYYTLDGSDPRAPGGGVATGALPFGSGGELPLLAAAGPTQVRFLAPTSGALGMTWTLTSFNDSGWDGGTGGTGVGFDRNPDYDPYIDWDVEADVYNITPGIYVRYTFNVDDPAEYSSLTLRLMYEDGYYAFLNGQFVGSGNVTETETPAWNATANSPRDEGAAVTFEPHSLTAELDHLRSGKNVLAIQAMSNAASSTDLLLRVELYGGQSSAGDPIPIHQATEVNARTSLGGSWSGLSRAVFVPDVDVSLRVTEVMYRPEAPPDGSPFGTDDFEFVELRNISANPVDLLGVRLTAGIEFDFSHGAVRTLGPGEYVVVVEDPAAFASRYDTTGMKIAGQYGGNLDNGGETIRLEDGRGTLIQEFTYDDVWYPVTDGAGNSLHIVDEWGPLPSWNTPAAWAPSVDLGGSPGGPEPDQPPLGGYQLVGDYNQDATVDISDAVSLLLRLFMGGGRPLPCEGDLSAGSGNVSLLDFNLSGIVDISDAIGLLNYLFLAGPGPAAGTACARIQGCPNNCQP